MDRKVLFFDIESHNAGKQWNMEPREFFRLGQYSWGRKGEIILTEDYDEMIAVIREADLVIGHNVHSFDLPALFGKDSIEPLQMAQQHKVLDTMVWANLSFPAPDVWKAENGRLVTDGAKPEKALVWLGLNNLCFQLELPGKTGDLAEIAKRYNPKGTLKADLDFSLIPLDDPKFREYARQDIVALRALALKLLSFPGGVTPYNWREQLNAAIDAQNSRNGFRVDLAAATARRDELEARKADIMGVLVGKYGLPTEGKMPWRSGDGKAAIFAALADYGITPETRADWPLTDTGNPSLSGDAMKQLTAGSPAEDLGSALAEIMGQRSLSQLTLDSVQNDGFVHPDITALQRSGRKSTTKPGLTVWTARGPNAIEKVYYVADSPEHSLVSFDYSNADARVVAAYSGDPDYLQRFAPGVDSHELTARLVWGDEEYEAHMLPGWETDSEIRKSNPLRQVAKMLTHAYSYGARAKTLSIQSANQGIPVDIGTCQKFVDAMDKAYPKVVAWQSRCAEEGNRGWVVNDWGRRMPVNPKRAFTQSSALYGQSGTREIMVDSLIRMLNFDVRLILWLKAQIHDELIFSIPNEHLEWAVPKIKELMDTHFKPMTGGQRVEFVASHGTPSTNWYDAGH